VIRAGMALLITLAVALPSAARAGALLGEPILGGNLLVATDGNVYASYLGGDLGSDSNYTNTLTLEPSTGPLFTSKSSPVFGSFVDLGPFQAGTELVFRLDVEETGLSFFSGPAERNPDALAHVLAVTNQLGDLYFTDVGFEDTPGGGDQDYNDFMFRLYNVIDPPGAASVPVPSGLLLFLAGLVGLRATRWRAG
jgi:hypothetical protein